MRTPEPGSIVGVSRSLLESNWRVGPCMVFDTGRLVTRRVGRYGPGSSDAPDFFVPLHAEHLMEKVPELGTYLGLPPGSRFLLAPGHEDIWTDAALLDIEPQ